MEKSKLVYEAHGHGNKLVGEIEKTKTKEENFVKKNFDEGEVSKDKKLFEKEKEYNEYKKIEKNQEKDTEQEEEIITEKESGKFKDIDNKKDKLRIDIENELKNDNKVLESSQQRNDLVDCSDKKENIDNENKVKNHFLKLINKLPFIKNNKNSFNRLLEKINSDNISLEKLENLKTKKKFLFTKDQKISFEKRILEVIDHEKKIQSEIETIKSKYGLTLYKEYLSVFKQYASILAKELLITETFINRLSNESGRPIVVIGNGRTGKPYTWSLKNNNQITVIEDDINYPSTHNNSNILEKEVNKISNIFEKYDSENPIYLIVDSSKESRMPSALMGTGFHSKGGGYMPPNKSLYNIFRTKFKKDTNAVGYNWSKGGLQKLSWFEGSSRFPPNSFYFDNRLPKNNQNLSNSDVILFNPVGKGDDPERFSAMHDDRPFYQSSGFRDYVLDKVSVLKKNLFSEKQNNKDYYDKEKSLFNDSYPLFKELVDKRDIDFFKLNVGDQSKEELKKLLNKLSEEFGSQAEYKDDYANDYKGDPVDTESFFKKERAEIMRRYEGMLKWFEVSGKKEEKSFIKVPIRKFLKQIKSQDFKNEKYISHTKLLELAKEHGFKVCDPEVAVKLAANLPVLLGHNQKSGDNVITIGSKAVEENESFHHIFMVATNKDGRHLSIWDSVKNNDSIPIDGNDIVFSWEG